MSTARRYRGRFAPTPSGPLHFGSLVTALASWLDARAQDGEWLVRIDDLDPPREQPGAADQILRQLDACGLQWDGAVRYQSQRHESYRAAVEQLLQNNQAFYCPLSRSELSALGGKHPGPSVAVSSVNNNAIRLALDNANTSLETCFDDRFVGRHCDNLNEQEGAFVIVRRDGLYAYQLACALDDANDGITDVVRGSDLLASTSRQICVLKALSRELPRYAHLPLVTDDHGNKLSKSNSSAAINVQNSQIALRQALIWLGGPAVDGSISAILDGGIRWWRDGAIGLRHQDAGPAPEQSLP
jgi:glutamyl-Q tRNA(Asp) synthetase